MIEPPTELQIHDLGASFHIVWLDNSDNEAHFSLERKTADSDFEEHMTTTGPDQFMLHDTDIEIGTTYTYRIAGVGDDGRMSEYSNEVEITGEGR